MTASPIGTDVDRVEGRLKVTGGAVYAGDHILAELPGLAHGYLVTSTIGLGTITAMDTTQAVAAPGVLAVYTPFNSLKLFAYGGDQNDEFTPPLQDPQVRYRGQVIGLVVAETFEQARDAAGLVITSYAARQPSASFADALPSAPPPGKPSGFLAPGVTSIDDVLAAGPVSLSATYTTSIQHHHAMEPHATVAAWTGDHVTLYTVTQGTPLVVSRMAHTLGVDAAKIHVVNPYVGGAFGGKWGNWAHTPLTAAAARSLGRPVKTLLTREQVFTVVGHRPQTSHTVSLAAGTDGVLTALKHDAASSKSASANFSENAASVSLITYAAPNIQTFRRTVLLDLPATTIMRAPAEANGSFALECAMDELAFKVGADPLELRRRNYASTVPGSGQPWSGKHLDECYRVGAEKFRWAERNPVPRAHVDGDWLVGLGMGTATYHASRGDASVKVRLRADGTAVVSGTASDSGTG
ncbi:MAG TPA: molybdopterin cofactor-binding domain-containing protein, partial [Amycolatopsis sp.]|nr:molybdopterin cofactor-binding domain-containing protein [Amycolatopsis sp.]